ncbi:MAG: EAL domain-containing protein [Bdellovibrionales bacterium]
MARKRNSYIAKLRNFRAHSELRSLITLCVLALVFGVILVFLATISAGLAFLSAGFMAIGLFTLYERFRRNDWEQAVDFKLRVLKEKQDAFAQSMARNAAQASGGDVDREIAILRQGTKLHPHPAPANSPFAGPVADFTPQIDPITALRAEKPAASAARQPMGQDEGADYSDAIVHELLHQALRAQKVEVFLQPIQRLPQRQTKFYEIFARLRARPGVYIPANRYKNFAEADGILPDIDILLLTEYMKTLKKTADTLNAAPFFVNITAKTLKNTVFMSRLLAFLSKNRDLSSRLVFEIHYNDFHDAPMQILEIIKGLGQLGCKFSLDHVETLEVDVADLQRFHVRFVKAHADLFLNACGSDRERARLMKAKRMLEGNGVSVIVERIETEDELRELLDFDINYGQGYLFGRPDLQGAYANDFKPDELPSQQQSAS